MNQNFETLPLKSDLLDTLRSLQFAKMTPIQAQSLPFLLKGRDVIAQAKTGSGKTAAFGLCILNRLDLSCRDPQALVLCPTRELANQVAEEIRRLARGFKNTKVLTLCGGVSKSLQLKGIEAGGHIVVGTPGRVLFHLKKENLSMESLLTLTLDEADRMLEMGFQDEIMEIVGHLPKERQSLLFSATYPTNIKDLGSKIQKNALEIKTDITHESSDIEQICFEVSSNQDRNDGLYKILSHYRPERAIVFCKTKKDTYDVAQFLAQRNISAGCLNGDLEQNQRVQVLEMFTNKSLSILVATDVAGRGLDIENLPAVINYHMPAGPDEYVHRMGRTGRAGKKGLVLSFVDSFERDLLDAVNQVTKMECAIKPMTELVFDKKYDLDPPMKTMYISGGKKDKLRAGDIVGALVGEANLDASVIGDISVQNAFTFVAVESQFVEQAIAKLTVGKVKNRKFKVGLVEL